MQKPIYYTKMLFRAYGSLEYQVFLNIVQRELSYQKFDSRGNVVWSYGIVLLKEQINSLLPYANALDFEPYRGKNQWNDFEHGFRGYRDGYNMYFVGITDSHIPKIELPMDVLYDYAHTWPNEKMYEYLVNTYFSSNNFKREASKFGVLL